MTPSRSVALAFNALKVNTAPAANVNSTEAHLSDDELEARAIDTANDVLIQLAKRGHAPSVDRLMKILLPQVQRWARTHVESGDDADDVAQRTLIRVAKGLSQFDGSGRFEVWAHQILRRCVADHYRDILRNRRRSKMDVEWSESDRTHALINEEQAENERAVQWIRKAFLELPNRQREIFDLIDLQGLSPEEAGQRLGVATSTVRVHLHRARRAMRSRMLTHSPSIAET